MAAIEPDTDHGDKTAEITAAAIVLINQPVKSRKFFIFAPFFEFRRESDADTDS